jgi:hypothetical protein
MYNNKYKYYVTKLVIIKLDMLLYLAHNEIS